MLSKFVTTTALLAVIHLLEVVPANVGQGVLKLSPIGDVYFVSTPLVSQTLANVVASGRSHRDLGNRREVKHSFYAEDDARAFRHLRDV